jgi:hypothetical protein
LFRSRFTSLIRLLTGTFLGLASFLLPFLMNGFPLAGLGRWPPLPGGISRAGLPYASYNIHKNSLKADGMNKKPQLA